MTPVACTFCGKFDHYEGACLLLMCSHGIPWDKCPDRAAHHEYPAPDDPTAPQPLTSDEQAEWKAHFGKTDGIPDHAKILRLIATVEQLQAEVDRLTADLATTTSDLAAITAAAVLLSNAVYASEYRDARRFADSLDRVLARAAQPQEAEDD